MHPDPPGSPPGEDRVRASRWMCFALAANAFLLPRSSRNPKRGPVHPRDAGCVPWRGTGRVPWGASPPPGPLPPGGAESERKQKLLGTPGGAQPSRTERVILNLTQFPPLLIARSRLGPALTTLPHLALGGAPSPWLRAGVSLGGVGWEKQCFLLPPPPFPIQGLRGRSCSRAGLGGTGMTGAVLWVVALRHASRDTFPPRALSEKCPWEPPNHPPGSAAPSSPSKLGFPSAGGAGPFCFTFPLLPSLSSPCAHPAWPRSPLGMVHGAWSCWLGTRAGDPTGSHAWLEIPSCHPLVLEAAQKTPLFGAGCFSPSVPRLCPLCSMAPGGLIACPSYSWRLFLSPCALSLGLLSQ